MKNADDFMEKFTTWVKRQKGILGVFLVGSYARGTAKSSSDLDLVLITTKPETYTNNNRWLHSFGKIKEIRNEDYKVVKAIRVFYSNGLEIEYGITTPAWIKTNPIDPGTKQVITAGSKIIYDKDKSLESFISEVFTSR